MEPRLEPVRAVCELLGDPQRAYPVIHLTGTNGKTSTARMVERLLREHNLRTGRFTSPHLHSVTERISVDGRPLPTSVFADTWDEVAPLRRDGRRPAGGRRRAAADLLRAAHRAWRSPRSPTPRWTSPWSRWASAAPGTPPTSPTPPSRSCCRSRSTTPRCWATRWRQIAEEKAGIFTEGGYVVMADQPVEAAEVLLRRAVESGSHGLPRGPGVRRRPARGGARRPAGHRAGRRRRVRRPVPAAARARTRRRTSRSPSRPSRRSWATGTSAWTPRSCTPRSPR